MDEHRVERLQDDVVALSDPAGAMAALLEHTPTPLALYTPGGRFVRANAAFSDLFGDLPRVGSDLSDNRVLAGSGALFWLRRALAGETITTPTFWCERHTAPAVVGRRRVAVSARAFPLPGRDGRGEVVAIAFRDETDAMLLEERRRSEVESPLRLLDAVQTADAERRENEDLFRAVFEQCADGVMITDDSGRVIDINPSGCEIFGRRREDVVGTPFWDHIGEVPRSRAYSEALLRDGRLTVQVRIHRADGALRDLQLRAVSSFLPGRHLTSFLDVTEREDAMRAMRRSEAHLVASQRIAHVGSWEIDLATPGDVARSAMLASDECYRIFGVDPEGVDLTPGLTLGSVHPDDRARVVSALREAVENRSVYVSEHRIRRADGSERVVLARGEIESDPGTGRPLRFIGTTQDITERARTRAEIHKLNAELEQRVVERTAELASANHDLEAFAYSVSHDLRAPLRAIAGYARFLLDDDSSDVGERRHALDRIEASAHRMDGLIDGLLALSRLGRRPLALATVDVAPLVGEILDELGLRGDRAVEVALGDLPQCRADPSLLRQVFANLIGNAVKFSRTSAPARIAVDCAREHGEQVWCVRDNGIGIDMDRAAQIFGVFARLPEAGDYDGHGIGLAIVERIVRLHGGRIWVESAPGRGAAFRFTI